MIVISYNTRWWNKNAKKVQNYKPKPPPSDKETALSMLIRYGIVLQLIGLAAVGSSFGIILGFICLFVLYHWLRIDPSENSDFNLYKLEILKAYSDHSTFVFTFSGFMLITVGWGSILYILFGLLMLLLPYFAVRVSWKD